MNLNVDILWKLKLSQGILKMNITLQIALILIAIHLELSNNSTCTKPAAPFVFGPSGNNINIYSGDIDSSYNIIACGSIDNNSPYTPVAGMWDATGTLQWMNYYTLNIGNSYS